MGDCIFVCIFLILLIKIIELKIIKNRQFELCKFLYNFKINVSHNLYIVIKNELKLICN